MLELLGLELGSALKGRLALPIAAPFEREVDRICRRIHSRPAVVLPLVAQPLPEALERPAGKRLSAQQGKDRMLATARELAVSVIGLPPSGADIYARRVVAFSSPDRLKALTRLDMLIGEELARQKPDRSRLAQLTEAVAREEATLARTERQHTIATAFQLSERDRRALVEVIRRSHKAELASGKPVFSPFP